MVEKVDQQIQKIGRRLIMACIILMGVASSCARYDRELVVEWRDLTNHPYTIKYFSHNFNNFPTDSTMDLEVREFAESEELVTLDSIDIASLVQLISDSTNFGDADCGTFALNAGIIVFSEDKIKGEISIGCGFNQWNFKPFNPNCKWGGLNRKGFERMTKMLDRIEIRKRNLGRGQFREMNNMKYGKHHYNTDHTDYRGRICLLDGRKTPFKKEH